MQLNELLENHSIKEIAKLTNISEENLDALFREEFNRLTKVKALGFIAIVERETKADLSVLRKTAKSYYQQYGDDGGMVVDMPVVSEHSKGRRWIWWLLLIVGLAGGAFVWFRLTGWDLQKFETIKSKLHSNGIMPSADQHQHPFSEDEKKIDTDVSEFNISE